MTGSRVATTARSSSAAAASAAIPGSMASRDGPPTRAPSSAASSAPPDGASSSAWSRGARPSPAAASRTRRDWSALKTPVSQNTSAKRARPWAATPGSCSSMSERTNASVPSGRDRNSGGTACAPEPGRHDVDRAFPPEPVRDVDAADLGLEVQAVTGLRLDRGHPVAEHLVEPAPPVGQELLVRGGPGRRHGREDPAARRQDLEVRRARAGAGRARPRACPRTAGGCAGR